MTLTPTGIPWRTLKAAIDFVARLVTGRWPVMRASSSVATSMSLTFCVASPRPMFTTTFSIFGTAITFE